MVKPTSTQRGKRIRTGVAISATELCAADLRLNGKGGGWRAALEPPNGESGWPSLANALSELARALGVRDGVLAVSLMPPLTEVRRLDLPPLRDDERLRLLARNAPRYFVNARGPQVIGASSIGRRQRGVGAPVIAAAASTRLVAAIHLAAQQSGWTIESVAPAETAWCAAACALWPSFSRHQAHVIIAHHDRTDLLELENGRLVGVRRFRGGGADASIIADSLGPTARVGVTGAPEVRRDLVAALDRFGVRTIAPVGDAVALSDTGDLLAAHFAGAEGGPVLRSEDATTVERAQATKLAWRLAGAAAALVLLSSALELWSVKRQLRAVRDERAALRGQIAATLVGRTTLDATYRQLAALNGIERGSPRWSSVITTLSQAVPDDAYLTALRIRQDSVIVDGLGEHAARVFDALARTPGLADVRAAAPVRREAQDEGSALEHFTIAARVERPSTETALASPASNDRSRKPTP
jgi:Tfp pilus assembly protein PilN